MRAREAAAIAAVVFAALSFGYGAGWPDVSRLGLTESIVLDGTLRIDRYASQTQDRADFGGHSYSDKAPGNSFLAVPPVAALAAAGLLDSRDRVDGVWHDRRLLWLLRVLTGGLAFIVTLVLVRVAAERVAAGTGTLTAVTVGAATMAMPLAATVFSHLAAGSLVFAAFLLVWRRVGVTSTFAAGACAGAAVLFEYTAAVAASVVLGYVLLRTRRARAVLAYLAGSAVFLAALGAYNAAAFGSPRHFSYRYEAPRRFPAEQKQGFFGIHVPSLDSLGHVFLGHRGLFLVSPVLVCAFVGLLLLWQRGRRAEAGVAAGVTVSLIVVAAGYFEPYGGLSPGPRYMSPALPFLAVGLAEAYGRWPRATAALALVSLVGTAYEAGTWGPNFDWSTIWWWAGVPRLVGMAIVVATLAAAVILLAPDLTGLVRRRVPGSSKEPSSRGRPRPA